MIWGFVALLALLNLAPLLGLVSQLHIENLSTLYTEPSFLRSVWVTVVSAFVSSILSVALGLFFARQFALHRWRGHRLQKLLLLFPYLVPNFILAMSFVVAWNPATGLLNSIVRFPFGLYGLFGMTCVFAISHVPVAFLLLDEKLKRIDSSLREAARLSGASSWRTFFLIDLPLLKPSIMSALALCFSLSISSFAIPAWIGSPQHVYPLTYKIYQSVQLGGIDGLPEAAGLSLALLVLALIPLTLGSIFGSRKLALLTGKSSKEVIEVQKRIDFALFQVFFFVSQTLFWAAPVVCLLMTTVVKPGCLQNSGFSCLSEISFAKYHYVIFELNETRAALENSLLYGALSSFIIIGIVILTLGITATRGSALKLSEYINAIPLATPGAIIALGLIVVGSGRFGINIYNTAWIVVVAFVIKHVNLAFQPLRTGLSNISSSLIEAASLSGASRITIWRKIVLPILRPEVLGGFFLVFIPILGELTMSVFLSSPSFKSIGSVIFDLQDYADHQAASSLAIVLIAMVLLLNGLTRRLSGGKLGY